MGVKRLWVPWRSRVGFGGLFGVGRLAVGAYGEYHHRLIAFLGDTK